MDRLGPKRSPTLVSLLHLSRVMTLETHVFTPESGLCFFNEVAFSDSSSSHRFTPPTRLWIQGQPKAFEHLAHLPDCGLSIVGTRRASTRGRTLTRKTVAELSSLASPRSPTPLPQIVLSGLAPGIDTEAHRAALEFGIPTIAILGSGLEATYPQGAGPLRSQILAQGGLLISEYEPTRSARGYQFLERNRLLAAGSRATLVIEAPLRSGTLNTAAWARVLERDVYAVPCYPGDSELSGNQKLLSDPYSPALTFWDLNSLSGSWIEIPSALETTRSRREKGVQSSSPASSPLICALEELGKNGRVADWAGIQDWAMHQKISRTQLLEEIDRLEQLSQIREKDGIFEINPQFAGHTKPV